MRVREVMSTRADPPIEEQPGDIPHGSIGLHRDNGSDRHVAGFHISFLQDWIG
jgi:hypothetical protein